MKIRIGTRESALALAQSESVAARLAALGHEAELIPITTRGDRVIDRAFTDIGAFGVFVRDLEAALLGGTVDAAVHSYKDVPSRMPLGLMIAAVPERVDAADVLLVRRDALAEVTGGLPLAIGATVGTSATRRRALLLDARPDLQCGLLRGNVPTRVGALMQGRFDAIVLAAAGLDRLAHADAQHRFAPGGDIVSLRLDPATFVPAPSQGAIAVQVRESAVAVRSAVSALDDASCRRTVHAERAALHLAEGGCSLPFGAWCRASDNDTLTLSVALGLDDGTVARGTVTGTDPDAVARAGWESVARGVHA